MESYYFYYNCDKTNEIINIIYTRDNNFVCDIVGNIYNMIDYINSMHVTNSEISFNNFKGNQINYVISKITSTKDIISISDYNRIIISDKKRKIRGKVYDKMD